MASGARAHNLVDTKRREWNAEMSKAEACSMTSELVNRLNTILEDLAEKDAEFEVIDQEYKRRERLWPEQITTMGTLCSAIFTPIKDGGKVNDLIKKCQRL